MMVSAFGFGVREITETERIYAEIINEAKLNITDYSLCKYESVNLTILLLISTFISDQLGDYQAIKYVLVVTCQMSGRE